MKRALITGVSGFTGYYLRLELEQQGWEVWGLGASQTVPGFSGRYLPANLLDSDSLVRAVHHVQPQVVFHLAGIAFVAHNSPDDFHRVNVLGTDNLLHALAQLPRTPEAVLLASSANVYGNKTAGQLSESTPFNPVNEYAQSKADMERMSCHWQDHLPLTQLRPFNYTGAKQSLDYLVPKIVDHFVRKKNVIELGNLDISRDFSDVRDVVRAYRLLSEKRPTGETVNICSGRSHSLLEVLGMAQAISNHELEVRVNPAFVRANEVNTLYGDTDKLTQLLGSWNPRPIKETLSWMISEASNSILESPEEK
ncbi:GDP-mannose 4,6-dehydratase [Gilvimarinus sp. 1_MG-2023]|uniref:GDP-mannose 4,6-dehydratase n=1 Tax=Gilvimarinus sp. 1_MG-2023 TaxID=3062638 RepID=UPI0026E2BC6C|nr:GDP-mannose 4,6-dehydratase [Gilvimarinus sp. 1_MG-2023]MDO6746304.1 GDP-mannose 4,6-dehydratase [Gilvimarinus sp. 1_MG-2023]